MTWRKWILISVLCSTLVGCGGPWDSGDRVLVSKCAYDNGFVGPHRYDVVVFKYPRGPMDKNTPKNYIKRLLGLPGELLAIFFGRIYQRVPGPNEAPFYDDLKDGKTNPNDVWEEQFLHRDEKMARDRFENGDLQILRKPIPVMMALRRIVYDNDYQAKDLVGKLDRWTPPAGSSWKADKATTFVNDGSSADKVAWLRYQHLLRPDPLLDDPKLDERKREEQMREELKKVKPMLILDTLDYNSFQMFPDGKGDQPIDLVRHIYSAGHWVGDLMIEANVEVMQAKGEFWFELSRGVDRFQARWDLTTGKCALFRIGKDGIETLGEEDTNVKGPGSYMLRLANFDARLTVWVDRSLPFGEGKEYLPPEMGSAKAKKLTRDNCGPTPNDLEPASIGSKGAALKISQVRLWRDTYYRTQVSPHPGTDHDGTMTRDDWSDPRRWDKLQRQRFVTMYVQPGHYLCLGDNSEASSDSRDWGLVPDRLMLGRALMVYYPIPRVGPIR